MPRWTVRGQISVRHGLAELRRNLGTLSALAGARVQVSGRKRVAGVWANWGPFGSGLTDAQGNFEVTRERDRLPRQFRVSVTLKDRSCIVYGDNKNALSRVLTGMSVLGGNAGPAAIEAVLSHTGRATLKAAEHDVHRDPTRTTRRAGTHRLGGLQLRSGEAQAHGDVWVLFHLLADLLRQNRVPFRRSVGIKFPHDNRLIPNPRETSYTNPFNHVCYIVSNGHHNDFNLRTILHELMHAWAFQNSKGEWQMAWQLLVHQDTHLPRFENPFVPFHEAFAEFAARGVERTLLPDGAPALQRPLSRQGLHDEDIHTRAEVEHREVGWTSVLNLLSTSDLDRHNFNTPNRRTAPTLIQRCNTPRVPLIRVMRAFRANSQLNLDWLRARDMRLSPFLARLVRTDGSFSRQHGEAVLELLNPDGTAQPWELFC